MQEYGRTEWFFKSAQTEQGDEQNKRRCIGEAENSDDAAVAAATGESAPASDPPVGESSAGSNTTLNDDTIIAAHDVNVMEYDTASDHGI